MVTPGRVQVDALELLNVKAALARLGGSGGWAQVLAGEEAADPSDLADLALLDAFGVVERRDGAWTVTSDEPMLQDGARLQQGLVAQLRRALQHAEGGVVGWSAADEQLMLNQGRASGMVVPLLVDHLLPLLPGSLTAFEKGVGCFLDVGVGVAAISVAWCTRFPGARAVGLDVLPEVLALARSEITAARLGERIELRQRSVADLDDAERYDLAWLPQPFIPPAAYAAGLARVLPALRSGGWLISPIMSTPEDATALDAALMAHTAHLVGGGPIEFDEVNDQLLSLGYVDVAAHGFGTQLVVVARRPPS